MCFHRNCYGYIQGKTGNVAALVSNAPPPINFLECIVLGNNTCYLATVPFGSEPGKVLIRSHLSFLSQIFDIICTISCVIAN